MWEQLHCFFFAWGFPSSLRPGSGLASTVKDPSPSFPLPHLPDPLLAKKKQFDFLNPSRICFTFSLVFLRAFFFAKTWHPFSSDRLMSYSFVCNHPLSTTSFIITLRCLYQKDVARPVPAEATKPPTHSTCAKSLVQLARVTYDADMLRHPRDIHQFWNFCACRAETLKLLSRPPHDCRRQSRSPRIPNIAANTVGPP